MRVDERIKLRIKQLDRKSNIKKLMHGTFSVNSNGRNGKLPEKAENRSKSRMEIFYWLTTLVRQQNYKQANSFATIHTIDSLKMTVSNLWINAAVTWLASNYICVYRNDGRHYNFSCKQQKRWPKLIPIIQL